MKKPIYKYGIELETCVEPDKAQEMIIELERTGIPFRHGTDGSIAPTSGNIGIEWRSEILTSTIVEPAVKDFITLARKFDVKVNESCGFHLHTSNKHFFQKTYLDKVMFFWSSIEDVLFSTQPQTRYNNHYCQRKLKDYLLHSFENIPVEKCKLIEYAGYHDRYMALNIASLARHGTIEVRLHNGTLNSDKIIQWIKLITAIYEYALTRYNKVEVDELFRTTISEEKISKVFKLLNLKDDTIVHFMSRIDRFGFKQLEIEQKNAVDYMKIVPELKKKDKEFTKIGTELEKLKKDAQRRLNNLSQNGESRPRMDRQTIDFYQSPYAVPPYFWSTGVEVNPIQQTEGQHQPQPRAYRQTTQGVIIEFDETPY